MTVHDYHDGTKHHFTQYARSLGYLDWASQPRPFRSFIGAPVFPLAFSDTPGARASGSLQTEVGSLISRERRSKTSDLSLETLHVTYDQLFQPHAVSPVAISASAIGDLLRHALGLSAWKRFRDSRWSLRVNPSSGNLHPTEAYIVVPSLEGLAETPAVYHYAPDRHALELRCRFDQDAWLAACGDDAARCLVALTSIHWREAWKYGERAFRYCQHDLGHAVAAMRLAAALAGWRATILPEWSHRTIAATTGIDRDEDFVEAEREEPACVLAVTTSDRPPAFGDGRALADAVRRGRWSGAASQLSQDHVEWSVIDEIARASSDPGRAHTLQAVPDVPVVPSLSVTDRGLDARALMLQRRSALAFDGRSSTSLETFVTMIAQVMPGPHAPWDALWWTPRIHLALFVHRVEGLAPGLYVLARDEDALPRIKAACGRAFAWERVTSRLPLFLLARGDCRRLAQRLSCDQEIAADGFFSLGMIAEFDASLEEHGPSFYRQLFWESGLVGQVLYLEAEAAGARATGIGCFFDDPVHDALGLVGHAFQSLYHFTVGMPSEDARLTTEAAYPEEIG